MPLTEEQVMRLAGLEVNALRLTDALPDSLERGRLRGPGTPVYDLNGTLLFRRVPIARSRAQAGYADIAVNEALGAPLIAVSTGAAWNERAILAEARRAAERMQRAVRFDNLRFVAYSFPKVAVQFRKGEDEVLMLEWGTWNAVPARREEPDRVPLQPRNFERWSLLDELPSRTKHANSRAFEERVATWRAVEALPSAEVMVISKVALLPHVVISLVDTREVGYSARPGDHHPCYQLRGQQTGVWCVAASTEMLLNYYRYHYNQVRIATELKLGTCANPNGLPYSRVNDVVTVIEKLSSNGLDATIIANPGWATFEKEIKANRPLISFIPGHSRTVVGYTRNLLALPGQLPFSGLLVYDPWPPTDCQHPDAGGVITKWENFATQTYQYAYSASLKHV